MDCSPAVIPTLRSTMASALLTVSLLACGNAQTGTPQVAADTTVQDWEVQPSMWEPKGILIPPSHPLAPPADSAADSLPADTTKTDSAAGDSVKGATAPADSTKRPAPVRARKSNFNISARDSALWPVKTPEPLPG